MYLSHKTEQIEVLNIIYVIIASDNMKFKVLIEKGENGYFVATVPALPGCISQHKTKSKTKKKIKKKI